MRGFWIFVLYSRVARYFYAGASVSKLSIIGTKQTMASREESTFMTCRKTSSITSTRAKDIRMRKKRRKEFQEDCLCRENKSTKFLTDLESYNFIQTFMITKLSNKLVK